MAEPVVETVDSPTMKEETDEQPQEQPEDSSPAKEEKTEEASEAAPKAPPPAAAPPPPPEPELSPEPAALPTASFHTVDDRTRTETHGKLRAYEARRRSAYTSKLESSSLYWRSFRDLLHASVHETARAERLVLGSAKANQTYADAMQATYEDVYLDDKGHAVTDVRKQKRLLEQRTNQEYTINATPGEKQTKAAELAEERRNGMLSSLIDSQAILAERFGENAKHVSTEIASELTALRAELQTQVKGIEKLGNAIVAELENAESEVEGAWDSYYAMAVKAMGASGAPVSRSPSAAEEKGAFEHCSDVWVVEMQYRVAVAYQSMAWEKGSTELSKLFASMKEAECQRRVKLREVLIAFLNRQERLFLSLPGIQTPVLKDLVGRQMDRDTIEEHVQLSIRKRAQSLQREESKKTKAPSSKGPGLSSVKEGDGDFKLESPLTSELLCKAKVIERKNMGMMSSWKTTLAVVTADSFLHLFDLPSAKVHSGSAAEVAFQALVPTVTVPTADNIKAGKASSFLKGWSENLTPSESLVLANCTIGSGPEAFEISETVCNTGASKMFGKVSTRKLMLRAVTKEETTDWIAALKDAQQK